ncbi:hypothetical protein ASPZODRAFT_152742 [Penicilliopsis zonata CBS 506.65]|uniref:Potassium transport protein n=1 Tax=Penicilliopsis zonata CBS 506.65 TaxID=1073090 RepID=A0A1L9SF15_9EURO|nr:hypothetical protein ASPZODRAFT_152742 [Penicilliopsis zonata CBS 506.65]OJJ45738.1 hypothetical protein ASPZODRAFT_152742 [Penicilliopsis zonata CBS 506.65]
MAVLPPFNFLTLHYIYFLATPLFCSIIFWCSSTPFRSVAYVDALFLCVSAMTGAGLNTVDLSTLNTFQQVILFLLLILGSAILISSTVLYVRKRAFESKIKGISEAHRRPATSKFVETDDQGSQAQADHIVLKDRLHSGEGGLAIVKPPAGDQVVVNIEAVTTSLDFDDQIQWVDDDQVTVNNLKPRNYHNNHRIFPMAGVGARPGLNNHPKDVQPNLPSYEENQRSGGPNGFASGASWYLPFKGHISRNSQFYGLTPAEREQLGGVEYKAVSFLSVIVPTYFFSFLFLGIMGMGAWVAINHPEVARENGLSPFWTGAFFACSAFNNSGMALLDANMTAFQTNAYPLLTMSILILGGNTLYPCFLRFIIWTMRLVLPNRPYFQEWRVVLNFILDHPRRVYTNLFPSRHTWYLLGTIIVLNGIDWAGFELLSIGNTEVDSLPTKYRILDGLFQASAVRSGGFYVVTISNLKQGLLVLYGKPSSHYVSAFPVLLTMRNTNVYEERSLGIYANGNTDDESKDPNLLLVLFRHHILGRKDPLTADESSRSYFVRQQLRSQLSHDIWWIALAVLFISIAEASGYERQPVAFSTFNIIFEVVSAYGCVGISVGYPGKNYSFCGAWHPISKLILAAVTLRGRHRGLPVAIDKAVMLPSESLAWAEEEDAALRRERSRMLWLDRAPDSSV